MELKTYNVEIVLDKEQQDLVKIRIEQINKLLKADLFCEESYLRALLLDSLEREKNFLECMKETLSLKES